VLGSNNQDDSKPVMIFGNRASPDIVIHDKSKSPSKNRLDAERAVSPNILKPEKVIPIDTKPKTDTETMPQPKVF
jgi:hypothetical protein